MTPLMLLQESKIKFQITRLDPSFIFLFLREGKLKPVQMIGVQTPFKPFVNLGCNKNIMG